MKYLMFWEFCPEDTDKVIAKNMKQTQLAKEHPEKWGKTLFPPHYYDWCKGMTLVEAEPEQVAYTMAYWFPELKMKFEPLHEAAKMTELYLQMKK